jgi:hypothetical protein
LTPATCFGRTTIEARSSVKKENLSVFGPRFSYISPSKFKMPPIRFAFFASSLTRPYPGNPLAAGGGCCRVEQKLVRVNLSHGWCR